MPGFLYSALPSRALFVVTADTRSSADAAVATLAEGTHGLGELAETTIHLTEIGVGDAADIGSRTVEDQ